MNSDTALCTGDGRTYYAHEFAKLPPGALAEKRHQLKCQGCEKPAFFVPKSNEGRAARFGARHEKGCKEASKAGGNYGTGGNEIENPGVSTDDIFVIDLNPSGSNGASGGPGSNPSTPGQGRQFVGTGGKRATLPHRRVSTLLDMLMATDSLGRSAVAIRLPGQDDLPANKFFVPFVWVKPDRHLKRFRGYWGQITNVSMDEAGTVRLDFTKGRDVYIRIEAHALPDIIARYGDWTTWKGCRALVLAALDRSDDGTCYLPASDVGSIAIKRY